MKTALAFLLAILGGLNSFVVAQTTPVTIQSGTISTPFYSAPNTFTPTATGLSATTGTLVTITNQAGVPPFSYSRPFSSVPPTGNVTLTNTGGPSTDLLPPTDNLQTVVPPGQTTVSLASPSTYSPALFLLGSSIFSAMVLGMVMGAGIVVGA